MDVKRYRNHVYTNLTNRLSQWTGRRSAKPRQIRSPGFKILLDLQGAQSKSRERGIGRLTLALAKAIIEQADHHEVHVLFNEDLTEALEGLHSTFSTILPPGRIHSFGPYGSVSEYNVESQWRARSAALLREAYVASLRPDIVHVGSLFEGFVDGAVTSIGRLKSDHATAATHYDLIPLADPDRYLADAVYRSYYLRHVQDLKRADALLAISQFSKTDAVQRLNIPEDKVAVIYAGVDPKFRPTIVDNGTKARIRNRLGTDDAFLLYVGAADPRKNVGLILEAYALLPPATRDTLSIVFVGGLSQSERDFIQAASREFGVPDHKLLIVGLVDDIDLIALYTMCEALVFPSTNEGFGLPPLEAMACGVPALVADATSLPEVVGRQDCLFDPYDAKSLAGRIVELANPGWRRALVEWGPQRARRFTWEAAGRRALDALVAATERNRASARHQDRVTGAKFCRRPRMAFVSPLPPDSSGIADYSAELLRELLIHYEIDCIHPTATTTDPWITANCVLRDFKWFDANANLYDRILYSIGNSTFHDHMFPRLALHPGVVILHDAFLSDLAVYKLQGAAVPSAWFLRETYASHGLSGLRCLVEKGRDGLIAELSMSGSVFRNAQGVIVHSRYAADLAEAVFGDSISDLISVVPLMRSLTTADRRDEARTSLSLEQDDFVVCCFGMVHSRKLNREVAEAFAINDLAGDKNCCLAFVGEAEPIYGAELQSYVASIMPKANVRFVGRASDDLYNLYLGAADVAVQLRTESRGETSKAVLDAMAHGLAVIVSDIGPASELPDDAVVKVPVSVTAKDLAAHLIRLRRDDTFRQALGAKAKTLIAGVYSPHVVGQRIYALIEGYTKTSARTEERALMSALGDFKTYRPPQQSDLDWVASQINALFPSPRLRQILVDVSAIAETDLRTGIERVVRAVLDRLIGAPPAGFRIEPVVMKDGIPVYARAYVETVLGLPLGGLPIEPVMTGPGDHYLALDWTPNHLPDASVWIDRFRRTGGTVTVVVYDLLPLEQPQYFPQWLNDVTRRWVDFLARNADAVACISQSVATSVERWTADARAGRRDPLSIGFFHLGSDIAASRPTEGLPPDAEMLLAAVRERPTFLILGTVEPRKGHNQLIAAFEQLWDAGLDIGLIVVGKEGWMVDATSSAIRNSSALGSKLHWLSSASDEFLGQIFGASTALVVASFGEGFGLPLIEAARHNKPIIVRDLPVFREVAGDHAFYFTGDEPTDLAMAVRGWLDLRSRNCLPDPSRIRSLDWAESTEQLLALMFAGSNRHDPRSTGQAALSVVS